ncbi:MFS transporter, DHA2 family, lincomycin resistance protein [Pseudonocardia thermophila]|jgi:drug resistance transporter, EmrB/QacA subfamily|uniref:MFS transporter, DHA2 family, lincomycin resistance protein n=1 Tax=Pseudonocardia thermophila TaxID=1848 RepID=A0A1M6PFZ7_PSETH|nr:MDR family MFS transporter [Pseudonocardia thermophila]SHK06868.1 MFS transporter, DHA2 family, lincomycin resistance protein [Pseudonocardia thermophila]
MTGLTARPSAIRPRVVIALLVGSAFVMILNETIMSVALPALMADLQIGPSTAQWLTSGFLLTMAVVIPATGWVLSRFAPRSIYLASMTLFSAGLLVAALAPGFGVLLVGRIVQAIGTAVMVPLLMTTVLRLVPAERRGATMGTITIVIAVAPAVGPTLSGIILAALGWRWMFWLVLPIALVAFAVGIARLRVPAETRPVPLDALSLVLSAVAFAGIVFGLSGIGGTATGEVPVAPWIPVTVGAVALAVFVVRQLSLQRADRALLDLRPFTHGKFVLALGLMLLGMMALFGALILLPLYMQDVLGATPYATGLALLPGGLAMGLLGPVVGRLFDKFGPRPLVLPGAIVTSTALWLFTLLGEQSPLLLVVGFHVLLTCGLSFMFTPLMTDALGSLPADLYSHGSAIVTTLQQVAGAAGTAVFITIMTLASQSGGAVDAAGTHAAFLVAAIISLAVVALSVLVGRGARAPQVPAATGGR